MEDFSAAVPAARRTADAVIKVYFTALAFLMYYFLDEVLYVGGKGITYRHLFALALVASAFVCFLIRPNLARGAVSVKSALVHAVPLLVVLVISLLVWVIDQSNLATIARGLSGCFLYTNWLSCALAAGAILYVFGEEGIWYNLLALTAANLLMIASILVSDGAAVYFREFFELVLTFAGTTGDTIVKAEIHELAFCLGAYLLYMLCRPKKKLWFWLLFAAAAFCFLSALKRIAVIAMAAVLLLHLLFRLFSRLSPKAAQVGSTVLMVITVVLLVAYIAVIKAGVFTLLEKAGVDTNGRAYIYEHVGEYYDFSPLFVGNGIGFLTYQLSEVVSLGVSTVHNDFLQFFVDLGFFGYLLWLLSITVLRTGYFGRNGDCDTAVITALLTVYLVIVSSTDNTMNYPLLNTVMGLLIIGNGYTRRVREQTAYWETHGPGGGRLL